MSQYRIERGDRHVRGSRATLVTLAIIVILLLIGARSLASYIIEIQWWKEVCQFDTWLAMLTYSLAPVAATTALAFLVLWIAHTRALKFAGERLREHPIYARISTLVLLLVGYMVAAASVDTWTVVRFAGSRGLPATATVWHDAVFGKPLSFYLFDLPFYTLVRSYIGALAVLCILLYWLAARGWQLRHRISDLRDATEFQPNLLRLEGGLESKFIRGAAVVLLLAVAVRFFLARYAMVYNEHGTFL